MTLTIKQKRFADEYIISGNKYEAAINAGYSENYAKAQSHRLLENVGIKKYIDEKLKEIDNTKVADQKEVLEFLTSVMRGEQTEEILKSEGADTGQIITDIKIGVKDRIKAAELLGKRYGTWTEKVDISADVDINIEVDYGKD